MGLFDWLSSSRSTAISDALWAKTLATLPFIEHLAVDEKKSLKLLVEQLLAEKEFSTGGGLQLTDEICVSIAAQGCLPILNLGLAAYREWVGIVVYPNEFVVPRQIEDDSGVVHEFTDVLSGEAWQGGPLIISWRDVQMAGDGYNVVIHEFAHKLDMLNGEADGIPALHSGIAETEWTEIFFAAYDDFCRRIDSGEETVIDPYASADPAEFFAVLSECFFELPTVVDREYPALYGLFKRYYRQDPLARLTRFTKATSAANTAAS
jgi:Mlc titration factor MtfA (ptsG expression regulator)